MSAQEKVHVIMLHGIRSHDSIQTLGRLRPFFIGKSINPVMFDYGYLSILTRFKNKKIAKQLADLILTLEGKIIVVGYSNGAAITYLAAEEFNAKIDKAVFINPALDSRINIPDSIAWVDVWHSPSDMAVKLGALRPFHIWGTMGAYGYRGKSKNVSNYNKEIDFTLISHTHNSTFKRDIIEYFGPMIVEHSLDFKGSADEIE